MNLNFRIKQFGPIVFLNVCLLMGVSGCSSVVGATTTPEPLVPVQGTIKFDGKPVEQAVVTFTPTGGNKLAHTGTGVTDSDGQFEMVNYHQKPGLPPGSYIVTVSLVLWPDGTIPPDDGRPPQSNVNQAIPVQWNNIAKAGRHNTVTVPEDGKTNFVFKIPKKK